MKPPIQNGHRVFAGNHRPSVSEINLTNTSGQSTLSRTTVLRFQDTRHTVSQCINAARMEVHHDRAARMDHTTIKSRRFGLFAVLRTLPPCTGATTISSPSQCAVHHHSIVRVCDRLERARDGLFLFPKPLHMPAGCDLRQGHLHCATPPAAADSQRGRARAHPSNVLCGRSNNKKNCANWSSMRALTQYAKK